MKIHLEMPSSEALAQFALEQVPDAATITVTRHGRVMAQCSASGRPAGVPYTFTAEYLWELMKIKQAEFETSEAARLSAVRG